MVSIKKAVRLVRERQREALEAVYDGTCRIYGMRSVKDPETCVTRQEEVLIQEGISCRVSFSGASASSESGYMTAVGQMIKLFLAPEIIVDPGSRIEVTQNGRTECYARSGRPAVYPSHQEIVLEIWKGYA